jgi:hypothetical protein
MDEKGPLCARQVETKSWSRGQVRRRGYRLLVLGEPSGVIGTDAQVCKQEGLATGLVAVAVKGR